MSGGTEFLCDPKCYFIINIKSITYNLCMFESNNIISRWFEFIKHYKIGLIMSLVPILDSKSQIGTRIFENLKLVPFIV